MRECQFLIILLHACSRAGGALACFCFRASMLICASRGRRCHASSVAGPRGGRAQRFRLPLYCDVPSRFPYPSYPGCPLCTPSSRGTLVPLHPLPSARPPPPSTHPPTHTPTHPHPPAFYTVDVLCSTGHPSPSPARVCTVPLPQQSSFLPSLPGFDAMIPIKMWSTPVQRSPLVKGVAHVGLRKSRRMCRRMCRRDRAWAAADTALVELGKSAGAKGSARAEQLRAANTFRSVLAYTMSLTLSQVL